MKSIPIVIQASNINETMENRLGLPLGEDPSIIVFLIRRLQKEGYQNIAVASSEDEADGVFDELIETEHIHVVHGDFYDIPKRLMLAVEGFVCSSFVRVYATNPLVDMEAMNDLVERHLLEKYDYSYNENKEGVLWGTGCDVFKVDFLRNLTRENLSDIQKETIGQYIRQNDDNYKIYKYTKAGKHPHYKVNLETSKDYDLICELVDNVPHIANDNIIEYLNKHPLVAKYNQEEPAKETAVEKLFFTPEKADFILKHRLPDMTYPISVELTLTNCCNLACVYCSDMELRTRQGMKEYLSLDVLKNLFEDLSNGGTKGVVLEGGGEPTMHPDFSEIVRAAKGSGLAVGLITNGTHPMDEADLKQFEWIRVSLDASTAEEYKNLKGVDCFEKVIDNIAKYAKSCETVGIGYVVTSNNISQIEALIIRLRELGASYVQCRPVVDCTELYPEGIDLSYLKYYQTAKFGVMIDGMSENATTGNSGLPCYAHSITSIISGDGSVYICGRLNIYDWLKPIGNITDESFRRIWYGVERQNQAEMLFDKEFCLKNCPQCRISKFNQMFYRLGNVQTIHFI